MSCNYCKEHDEYYHRECPSCVRRETEVEELKSASIITTLEQRIDYLKDRCKVLGNTRRELRLNCEGLGRQLDEWKGAHENLASQLSVSNDLIEKYHSIIHRASNYLDATHREHVFPGDIDHLKALMAEAEEEE